MRVYTVHIRAETPPALVPEGFCIWAFLFGPFWLLFQRAWIPAALAFAAAAAGAALPPTVRPAAGLAGSITIGLFGRDLVRWSLERRGFVLAHVVVARDSDAALVRVLDADPALTGVPQGGMGA
jgi:hypothetical protein